MFNNYILFYYIMDKKQLIVILFLIVSVACLFYIQNNEIANMLYNSLSTKQKQIFDEFNKNNVMNTVFGTILGIVFSYFFLPDYFPIVIIICQYLVYNIFYNNELLKVLDNNNQINAWIKYDKYKWYLLNVAIIFEFFALMNLGCIVF